MRVKPKLVGASRELTDAVRILREFKNKHGAGGKLVFTKTLQFYLDELNFEPKIVMAALDQEIVAIMCELEKINQLRLDRIKSA